MSSLKTYNYYLNPIESSIFSRWSAFAMKSVRKVTVYGDPWLVVSSAGDILFTVVSIEQSNMKKAVYTLQDMVQVQGFEETPIPMSMRVHLVVFDLLLDFCFFSSCKKVPQDFSTAYSILLGEFRLKVSQSFFSNSSDVYPHRWDWQKLWENDSSYKNLKLFDRNGNFIVDVELLESHGLLCHEYMEVQVRLDI